MILKTSEHNTLAKSGCGDRRQQAGSRACTLLKDHDQKEDACDCNTRHHVFDGKIDRLANV